MTEVIERLQDDRPALTVDCRVVARLVAEAFGVRAAGVHLTLSGGVEALGRYGWPDPVPAPAGPPMTPPCLRVTAAGAGMTLDLGGRLLGMSFYAGVPIVVGGVPVGVLCLFNDRPVRGSVDVLPLLTLVAAEVARVLQDRDVPEDSLFEVMAAISRSGIQHCW